MVQAPPPTTARSAPARWKAWALLVAEDPRVIALDARAIFTTDYGGGGWARTPASTAP